MHVPRPAIEQELTIVHVNEVVHNLVVVPVRCVQDHELLHEVCVKDLLVQSRQVRVFGAEAELIRLVHLYEFLWIADLLSEEHESGQLAHHVGAD